MVNEVFITDIVFKAFTKAGIPAIRLDPHNVAINNANFVMYVAPLQLAFTNPFNSICFSPVLFNDFKLLLVVSKSVKVPENVLKITNKILFYDSPDELIEQINLMARYAKEIYSRVS